MVITEQPVRVVGRVRHAADGTRIALRTCPLCECMCGLELHLDDADRVKVVRGDREDVWSKGYLCPKGTTLGKLHDDPDRVRVPMIREGDTFREASWDEAFARCQELIAGDNLAPEGSIPPAVQEHLLRDIGPKAAEEGGDLILVSQITSTFARGLTLGGALRG
jgi:anaerobic selenocysteine-containing dehydrogenase